LRLCDAKVLGDHQIDAVLLHNDLGVDLALARIKAWSKYAKDVLTYVEKKTTMEFEFARNLSKLAQTTRPILNEESFLPFKSIYCISLDQVCGHRTCAQFEKTLMSNDLLGPGNVRLHAGHVQPNPRLQVQRAPDPKTGRARKDEVRFSFIREGRCLKALVHFDFQKSSQREMGKGAEANPRGCGVVAQGEGHLLAKNSGMSQTWSLGSASPHLNRCTCRSTTVAERLSEPLNPKGDRRSLKRRRGWRKRLSKNWQKASFSTNNV